MPNTLLRYDPQKKTNKSDVTLLGTNISPTKAVFKMIFLLLRWDMLVLWRVIVSCCLVLLVDQQNHRCNDDLARRFAGRAQPTVPSCPLAVWIQS